MSTYDLKLQQSSCQSGVKASVTCVVSDQERLYTHTDKSRFQNVSEQEKSHPVPSALNIHKEDLETRTTASSPSLQSKGQQKSIRNLQIKQIRLIRSWKNTNRTAEEQKESSRFTSTISISLPSRNKKDTEEKTLHTTTNFNSTLEAVKNTANQHHTELKDVTPREQCGQSTGELFKDEDGQKATFNEGSLHQHGHVTPQQGQNTGIQHNIDLHEQIVHKISHSHPLVHKIQTDVTNESGVTDCRDNAPTPQYQNKLDFGLKGSSEVINQVLSLASFSALHSEETPEPEPNLISPTSAMLTSALASVLAPPWSGRLRRPKQGGSEVEHEAQDYGQNVNPSTLLRQDRRQQPFIPLQRQPSLHTLANDNDIQVTAGTSYSPDWQKENNSPNVTTTIQPKRPIMKFSSVDTMYRNTELHPFPTPPDTHQVPELPYSGYKMSETADEQEPFKSLSSKPTTSSLLLSLRRSNLRSSSTEPTQTPITRSVRSLTLPNRIVLKTPSFAHSVTPDDQNAEYPDTPTKTEGIPVSQFPFSPRIKSRVPLHTQLFLNKPETNISKRLETSVARAEDVNFPHPTTKIVQRGILKTQQRSYSVILREYSSTEDIDPVKQRTGNNTNLQNSNITKKQMLPETTCSPKDSKNFNIRQPSFNIQNLKSQSIQNITASSSSGTSTFTDRLNNSPRKDSYVDEISPKNVGQIYLDSKKYSHSSQSSMDFSSPISPSRPLRSVRVPNIYSYLRQSSPTVSTPSPSTPSSHINKVETTPPKQDGGITFQGDRKTPPSRFSFDFNPFVPQVQALQSCSYGCSPHIAPAQSLPPDFGRGSAPRLSTSPYSGLISSRPALSNTLQERSSPPASKTHTRSTSYDIVTTRADLVKGDPNSSPSTYTSLTKRPKEHLAYSDREQRRTVQAYTSTLDIHRPAQPCLSQTAPDASFVMESRRTIISPHPRQPSTGSNNLPHQEHDGLMALQLDKGNAYSKHRLSEKEKYLLSKKLKAESETQPTTVHVHERLQETQSPSSKKGLFASRVKKDNGFTSASLPDKDVVSPQYLKTKRHSPVFKTSSRIDQMLNRLKMTFGVKRSDSTLDPVTKKNKTPTQQPSDTDNFEKPKIEEKACFGSQQGLVVSLTADKASLDSLSPLPLRISDTLNMNRQNRSKGEVKYSGCTWEAPNSSLTTDKASLSPLTLKRSDNTLNMDWTERFTTTNNKKNGSGSTWEASNSSLTTDKASLSPLTLKRSDNTLNMDWTERFTTTNNKKNGSGSTWEASNSSLTTDKPSFRSFSPLTLKESKNTSNMDWEKRSKTTNKQNDSGSMWEASNSSLTTDKEYLSSFRSLSPIALKKSSESELNVDQNKRHSEENGNRPYGRSFSPHRLKAQSMNQSATLPHYRKFSVGPPSPFNFYDFDSEDTQNDNVFYSPVSKKTNSLCESDDFSPLSCSKSVLQQTLVRSRLSSSCADLKYGLQNGRSFSVNSVVSSRPSGPGRISTSSISDLSSLDDFILKGNYTVVDSPFSSSHSPSYDAKSVSGNQSQPEYTDEHLEHDFADPTPPPSPTLSSSPRRMSQAPAMSSPMRTTPENLSPPRGILPSRSYATSLTDFESGSDTTTDDEYYLGNGDEVETEL